MLGDIVVVDAVVHPYDLSPENQDPHAVAQVESVFTSHTKYTGDAEPEYALSRAEFFTDFSYDVLADALFVESDVDFAYLHSLPNLGFAKGFVTDPADAAAFRDAHPQRFGMYATVDSHLTDAAIGQLEAQVANYHVDGLKLYPAFFYDGKGEGWRLDGPDFAQPLLEAAHDLGIRHVAVHKALWVPPAPKEAFRVDDMDGVLDRFPDMTFEIVHAGMAFLDETIALMQRHPNMYATLESIFSYVLVRPDVFARSIGAMVAAVGPDRLLFASGANLMHPRPSMEAFMAFHMPAELDLPDLTDADKRAIMGGNKMRMHGLDAAQIIASTQDDEYAARHKEHPAPWHSLRDGAHA